MRDPVLDGFLGCERVFTPGFRESQIERLWITINKQDGCFDFGQRL